MCGGTPYGRVGPTPMCGLSPRVRGNRPAARARTPSARSIPACAGEPTSSTGDTNWPRVYPRVCGGTGASDRAVLLSGGLSPRVRGNRASRQRRRRRRRSIPACAGEPLTRFNSLRRKQVYPRVCGGTPSSTAPPACDCGLSPRVRGNPQQGSNFVVRFRSIPACAGEPPPGPAGECRQPVYPRVCGGTSSSSFAFCARSGLSPRVRGNRSRRSGGGSGGGSIPACAGEPRRRCRRMWPGWVYPRVCGGTRCSCPGSRIG